MSRLNPPSTGWSAGSPRPARRTASTPIRWRRARWKRRCGPRSMRARARRPPTARCHWVAGATARTLPRRHCSCARRHRTGSRARRWMSAAACGWTEDPGMTTADQPVIGFIGLGDMGGPMCRNMALKHPGEVIAYDAYAAAFAALDDTGAVRAGSVGEVAARADIVFLSLPGGTQVEAVCTGSGGLAEGERKPAIVVDLSTTSVEQAQAVAAKLA